MALGVQPVEKEAVSLGEGRQPAFLVVEVGVGVVAALYIGPQEARERDHFAAGGELGILARS